MDTHSLKNVVLDDEARHKLEKIKQMREYKDPLLEEFEKEMTADTHSGASSSPQKSNTSKNKKGGDDSNSDDDDSGSSSGDSDSDSDQEEGIDIEFPR